VKSHWTRGCRIAGGVGLSVVAWVAVAAVWRGCEGLDTIQALAVGRPRVSTEGTKRSGHERDAIKPLDRPVFAREVPLSVGLTDEDLVLGVVHCGVVKAYPLWILSRREIANDRFSDQSVCVTYCPVSASGVAFRSVVRGREVEFGNDGGLHEGNLVMYDRQTGSRWYQLRGEAISGDCAGDELVVVPSEVAAWGDWRRRFPESLVLVGEERGSRFFRVGADSPSSLGGRAEGEIPRVNRTDPALPARQRILGYQVGGSRICFPEDRLRSLPEGLYPVPGWNGVQISRGARNRLRLVGEDGVEVLGQGAYWFAWHAAFPSGVVVSNRNGG